MIARLWFLAVLASICSAARADEAHLAAALASQPEDMKARYAARHPAETLKFFGIEPGMTVVEALPGQGWYTKILLPYLGEDGHLIGADYSAEVYRLTGWFDEDFLSARGTWVDDWTTEAAGWSGEGGCGVGAFVFGALPDGMKGTADAVLLIRALHNFARFEDEGRFLTTALKDTYEILKPGGIVGVVQHRAPAEKSDEWADGSHGYLKTAFVVQEMQEVGFELVASSEVNANPKDQPGEEDTVWRLPPSLGTSRDDPELAAKMKAIGESDRMTLKFRKPG